MVDFILPLIIIALLCVIFLLGALMWYREEQYQQEKSKLLAAILSQKTVDVSNYRIITEAMGNKEIPQPQGNSDEIDLTTATDEVFDNFIKEQVK